MKTARLEDGTEIHCITRPEALAIDRHIDGYFSHGFDVREGDTIVDVGANIGLFGLRAVQRTRGRARVIGFEPVPPIFDVLSRNVERHGRGAWMPLRCGLAREKGEITISYYPRSPGLSTAHPHIWGETPDRLAAAVLGGARNAPGAMRIGRFIPARFTHWIAKYLRGAEQRVKCETKTLSDIVREQGLVRIDFLKVDVEGGELDVLLGLDASDWPKVNKVVTEVHDLDGRVGQVTELLKSHGLTDIVIDTEPGFERTVLRNVFARRRAS